MPLNKVREYYRHYYADELGLGNVQSRIERRLGRERSKKTLERLRRHLDFDGKKVLDVGCGPGEFVVTLNLEGIDTTGLTPFEEEIEVAREWQAEFGLGGHVVKGCGEDIPFPDGSFDIVISNHVLEHVKDVEKTLSEMVRVLKPGGHLAVFAPNYLKPKEGHYKIPWLPFLPKPLGRLYLRLRGRPTGFIGHINYITPSRVKGFLRRFDVEITELNKAGFFSPIEIIVKKDA